MDDLKKRGFKAFGWDFTGRIATQGVGFAVTICLARLLEPEDFGLVAMVMVIVGMAQVFTDAGLSSALIQRRRALPVHYSSAFYFNIAAGLALAMATYFSAAWIGRFYSNEMLVPLAQVLSLTFLINAFSSVQTARLRKQLENRLLARCSLTAAVVSGVIGVTLAMLDAGVWALVAQALSHGVVYNLVIWSAGSWVPGFKFSIKALMQLWEFGFRMFLSALLEAVFSRIDYLIIGRVFTPQLLGFFQRAKSLNMMAVTNSSASLMSVLFPYLSEIQNDLPRLRKTALGSLEIICFIVFALLGGLYVVSTELIVLLFGEKWLPSVEYFEILLISGFGYPVSALLVNILSSRGKSKDYLRLEVLKKVLLGCNLLVLLFLGIEFYLYGLIVTATASVSLNALFAAREMQLAPARLFSPILAQAGLALAAVSLTIVSTAPFDQWPNIARLIMNALLFSTIYFVMNWLLKTRSFNSVQEQALPVIRRRFG